MHDAWCMMQDVSCRTHDFVELIHYMHCQQNLSFKKCLNLARPPATRFQHYDDPCRAGSGHENLNRIDSSPCFYLCFGKGMGHPSGRWLDGGDPVNKEWGGCLNQKHLLYHYGFLGDHPFFNLFSPLSTGSNSAEHDQSWGLKSSLTLLVLLSQPNSTWISTILELDLKIGLHTYPLTQPIETQQ